MLTGLMRILLEFRGCVCVWGLVELRPSLRVPKVSGDSSVSFRECYFGAKSALSSEKCECKWRPESPTRRSALQTPSAAPSVWGWPWPRSRRGTWEINWAGFLAQQVSRLSSTHPGPICQLASCSTEPWQQGTASPARLHYACQMG